jgi:hypothetical protein
MTLPEIPVAAWSAAARAEPRTTDARLSAAWPHLYAAALRHAAGVIEDDEGCSHGPVCTLRDLATEAEQA